MAQKGIKMTYHGLEHGKSLELLSLTTVAEHIAVEDDLRAEAIDAALRKAREVLNIPYITKAFVSVETIEQELNSLTFMNTAAFSKGRDRNPYVRTNCALKDRE
jgi:hypothetical protein